MLLGSLLLTHPACNAILYLSYSLILSHAISGCLGWRYVCPPPPPPNTFISDQPYHQFYLKVSDLCSCVGLCWVGLVWILQKVNSVGLGQSGRHGPSVPNTRRGGRAVGFRIPQGAAPGALLRAKAPLFGGGGTCPRGGWGLGAASCRLLGWPFPPSPEEGWGGGWELGLGLGFGVGGNPPPLRAILRVPRLPFIGNHQLWELCERRGDGRCRPLKGRSGTVSRPPPTPQCDFSITGLRGGRGCVCRFSCPFCPVGNIFFCRRMSSFRRGPDCLSPHLIPNSWNPAR